MNINKALKYIYISIYKTLFRLFYNFLTKIKKIDHNKVTIVLSRNNQLEGNLKYIHDELIEQIEKVKIHFVKAENKMNLNLFIELSRICDSRYLIIDDYYLLVYLLKPSSQMKIIQLWHAAGALKKFGYSTIGTKFGPTKEYLKLVPIHSNYTHVYVSSKSVVPFYAEAFNMSGKRIYPLGVPRTDLFFNEKHKEEAIKKIYSTNPAIKYQQDKVKVLFAPTYRAEGNQKESNLNIVQILKEVLDNLNEDILILIKPHPYMTEDVVKAFHNQSKIYVIDNYSINEWMLIADAFITDYSSAIFEYSLLKRPLAHFVPDLDQYTKNRGFYQDLEEVSDGEIIKTKDELIKWINNRTKNEFYDTSRTIEKNFDNLGNVSKVIANHFIRC